MTGTTAQSAADAMRERDKELDAAQSYRQEAPETESPTDEDALRAAAGLGAVGIMAEHL